MHRIAVLSVLTALALVGPGTSAEARSTGSSGPPHATWRWPVEVPRQVLAPFVAPPMPYGRGHRGVDLAAGPTLLAPAAGTVRFSGVVVDRPVLTIDHGAGVLSSYEPVEATVARGQSVSAGQPVGTILAGHCSSPCVHVGVRVGGQYVSPMLFFGGIPRAVLLPTR